MSPILFRAGARYHRQHPWQLALALLGVTLGVAVVVAVDVATGSSRRAFALASGAATGRATHEITGGPGGVPESLYVALHDLRRRAAEAVPPGASGGALVAGGEFAAAPVIDRYVQLPAHGRRVLRLLGVDPFAEAPFREALAPAAGRLDMAVLLTQRSLVLTRGTAAELGITAGDTILVRAGVRTLPVLVAGLLEPADALSARALADLAFSDISTAQEIAGASGVLDRIELRVTDAHATPLMQQVRALLPPGVRMLDSGVRSGATGRLTRAFDTNLRALALVALVFGMFLIYNAVTFSVVQRRPLFGLLRAQGVTARELCALVLAEAAVLGVVATALGVLAGTLLGRELVRLVARTINDLYFAVTVRAVAPEPATLLKALVLGLCATLLAAAAPAVEAVRTTPRATLARAVLERRVRRAAPRLAALGAAAGALACILLLLPSRSLLLGFTALFVLILAAALLTPALTSALMRALRPAAAATSTIARMAARGVSASLSRTAPAIAALGVAIAVGFAVTVMIASFRAGVVRWLAQTLQADLYIAAPEAGAHRTDAALDPRLAQDITQLAGVAGVSTYRQVALLGGGRTARLIAVHLDPRHRAAFHFLDAAPNAWAAFGQGALFVSESFAWSRGVGVGDTIVLPTDRGSAPFAIAAIHRDYSTEHGVVFIDRAMYRAWWHDDAITSVGVFLHDDRNADRVLSAIRALPSAAGVFVRPTGALRTASLDVFDRTFAITGVLRLLALIVAFVGVTGALMALQLERAREIGVLRAVGLTPAQVWQLITTQTALMGLAAAVLAVPLGLALSWAMVHVINRRSFGWSFDLVVGALPFVQVFAVGIGAAVLAGLYPAWRMARLCPAEALRDE